ncbi:hypothetical protein BO71DRAFT_395290 [Aspergillus ellipticus CBS 707.79]|uniref:Uncharacterized protein n=1 Tax=Aspergillus ellipticus CBS 707.79 TaxID=1448320 RepID=A0A319DLS7_9EURO|nr:hypothetical protein BO71DRAFT_395290 [Aspergillus ellipticus CBS 707.79]
MGYTVHTTSRLAHGRSASSPSSSSSALQAEDNSGACATARPSSNRICQRGTRARNLGRLCELQLDGRLDASLCHPTLASCASRPADSKLDCAIPSRALQSTSLMPSVHPSIHPSIPPSDVGPRKRRIQRVGGPVAGRLPSPLHHSHAGLACFRR